MVTQNFDLTSAIDPIHTHCTIYYGDSDNYDIISNKLDICTSANVSRSEIVNNVTLVTVKLFTKWSTATIMPNEGRNLTGNVSTTAPYYSEAATTYLTTSFVTEVGAEFPE